MEIKGKVSSKPSEIKGKTYDDGSQGQYVSHTCVITEPKQMAGIVVFANRTLVNKNQEIKEGVNIGQEVTLYKTEVPDPKTGAILTFLEIGTGSNAVSASDLTTLFAKVMAGAQL